MLDNDYQWRWWGLKLSYTNSLSWRSSQPVLISLPAQKVTEHTWCGDGQICSWKINSWKKTLYLCDTNAFCATYFKPCTSRQMPSHILLDVVSHKINWSFAVTFPAYFIRLWRHDLQNKNRRHEWYENIHATLTNGLSTFDFIINNYTNENLRECAAKLTMRITQNDRKGKQLNRLSILLWKQ